LPNGDAIVKAEAAAIAPSSRRCPHYAELLALDWRWETTIEEMRRLAEVYRTVEVLKHPSTVGDRRRSLDAIAA
jgi:hypothetical protein